MAIFDQLPNFGPSSLSCEVFIFYIQGQAQIFQLLQIKYLLNLPLK